MKRKTKTRRTGYDFVIDLHGERKESARQMLDLELNAAFMRGCVGGRVICGQGKGILLRLIGGELARHPLVMSHSRSADGAGSYIVQLAPRSPSDLL